MHSKDVSILSKTDHSLNGKSESEISHQETKRKGTPVMLQPKLTVGAPDDPYEKEADAVADQVMRMPDKNFVQKKCEACEKEEKIQRETEDDELPVQAKPMNGHSFIQKKCRECKEEEGKEKLHRKPLANSITPFIQAKSNGASVANDSVSASIQSSRGGGSSLDGNTQSFMESRFGADFSSVKIHTSSESMQMNKELNAQAFTVGSDIYFNDGKYQPGTSEGKHLLAHELTHVVQQNSTGISRQVIQRQNISLSAGELSVVNVLSTPRLHFIPADIHSTRVGPEGRITPGLPGDTSNRMSVVIGEGMTFTEMAQIMLPLWNNATPFTPAGSSTPVSFTPLTTDELARGLLMYNFYHLGGSGFSRWQAGVRVPMPVFVETSTHTAVLHPLHIRDLASGFDAANAALLTQPAGASINLPRHTPDTTPIQQRQQAAAAFLAQYPDNASRGGQLLSRSLINARETRELVRRVLGDQADTRTQFDIALAFMNAAVTNHINILRAQDDGNEILGLVEMFLTFETFPDLDAATQANLDRALRMLAGMNFSGGIPVPGLAPACTNGVRNVAIDFVLLHGNTRNPLSDLQTANQVFQNCCVRLEVSGHHTVDQATTHQWLNNDSNLVSNRSCSRPALEERQMRQGSQSLFNLTGQIKAFYVDSFTGQRANVIGYAFTRECGATTFANHLVIRNNANDTTLAHEVGHLLLNAGHWSALDNLMHRTPTDRRLTPNQCRVIFNRSLQPKLNIGSPDDAYEKEADDMADKVMRMPEQDFVQRKCAECEKEDKEKLHRKPLSDGITSFIQAKSNGASVAGDSLTSTIHNSRGSGSSIDSNTQNFMGNRFGADFSSVKIHTGSESIQMNKELNAQAFTVGSDIFFNEGKYQPDTSEGKHLLAHELTHVVQQNGGIKSKTIQKKPGKKDQKADNPGIKYAEIIPVNQFNWKEFGFNHVNPFKHKGFTPFETPNAFANETFKIQDAIISLIPAADLAKFPLTANGIFGKATIDHLVDLAVEAKTDKESRSLFIKMGIEADVLDRFYSIAEKNVQAEPLLSQDFSQHQLFHLININKTFILSSGDENDAVRILQHVLIRLNYNIGEKGPDGKFGDDTVKALKAYQREAGLAKWEADGILGYKTLRLLDKRMSVAAKDFVVSQPGGNVMFFEVPVTRIMNKEEKLLHAIVHIFKVTEKQALELINNKDDENKWGWLRDSFKETTEAELNRGYEYIGVPIKDYESIVTIFKSKHQGYGEPLDPIIKEAVIDIEPYNKIYKLTKEIENLKSEETKATLISIAIGAGGVGRTTRLKTLIALKEKERSDELARLGITEDIYKTKTREFQKLFASYAVKVAFQMLDMNERDASLEMIRFKKSNDPDALEQGKQIKGIFSHLNDLWLRAEKEWWQGISIDQGAGADEITSEPTLNNYLITKKGRKRSCYKGDCIEPSELVLPSYVHSKFKTRTGNSYFLKAFDSNKEAYEYLKDSAETYPVLAYPKLELKKNVSKLKDLSEDVIESKLFATGESVKANIIKTRQALDESPMNVYKLKPVINMAKFQLGIFPDTIQDGLVNDAVKEFEDAEFWRNIGLAALGIGLGLLALVSGPVGWAALAAGVAVGAADAYFQYQDITFMRTAANTAFDPARALSDVEPGYFWFYVSLVFIGLDVFQGLKAVATVAKAAKATEEGTELAQKLITALQKDKDELMKLIEKGGDDIAQLTEQLKKLDTAINAVDAQKLARQINVLKQLHDLPQAVIRLSSSLDNAEVLAAFEKMATLVKKSGLSDDAYKAIVKFYAGPGNDFVQELPEFMRLAEKTDWTGKAELLNELLTNPRSQKIMLDLGENQEAVVKLWNEFNVLKQAGKATTFAEFLKGKGFVTDFGKTKSLAEQLGTTFSQLPTFTKNSQILRTVEPALADALLEKTLPKRIEEALTRILNTDIIGQSTDLARAQQRMKNSLRMLGATLETSSEYQQVVRLLKTTESKMAVFEKATSLAGHEEYAALITKYAQDLAGNPKALDDFLRIGPFTDDETFRWLLSKPAIRKLIADNPELVKALKKCASPCFPIHAEIDDIEKILTAIKNSGNNVDYARLNQYMYLNRPRNATAAELAKWKTAVDQLTTDMKGTLKAVNMPKGSEIPLPPRFKPGGATPLKDAAKKLDALIERGFSPKQLEDILVQANINKMDPNEFMEQLSRATSKLGKRPLDNISGIINGLSSTNPQKFETAYYFMRRIGDYSAGTGVDMVEKIFAVFDITEITKLRYSSASKLGAEAAKETGEISIATMEMFNTLVSKIDGSSEDIIRLALKAGSGGEENLGRLLSVVEKMPKGKHTLDAVEAKIIEIKELAKKIATAGDAMGDEIWGVSKTGGNWKVGSKFTDESGKISGAKVIAHIKGKADEIAEGLLDGSGKVSPSQWGIFRKSIENTDLPQVIKNGIIGEMWGKANVASYKKIFGAGNVFEQVTIRIKGTDIEAVVDAVIKKDGNVFFKEFKSGGAILSPGQEKVYEKMGLGLKDELEFAGEKASKIWPDPSKFDVGKVEIVSEFAIP